MEVSGNSKKRTRTEPSSPNAPPRKKAHGFFGKKKAPTPITLPQRITSVLDVEKRHMWITRIVKPRFIDGICAPLYQKTGCSAMLLILPSWECKPIGIINKNNPLNMPQIQKWIDDECGGLQKEWEKAKVLDNNYVLKQMKSVQNRRKQTQKETKKTELDITQLEKEIQEFEQKKFDLCDCSFNSFAINCITNTLILVIVSVQTVHRTCSS
eukprot:294661_1